MSVPTSHDGPPSAERPAPVWALLGDRAGDNRQVEALADALPWPVARRRVCVREAFARTKPRVVPGIHHLDLERSDALEAPWPRLVVTMGRRLSMVALWIAERSGGAARTVLLGKPSGLHERFDLVVPSAENVLPRGPNVLPIGLPLLRPDPALLERAAGEWGPKWADLPRPWTALLVGGPTVPFRFDAAAAERLAGAAAAARDGGTLFATTSPRTTPAILAAVERSLPEGSLLHRFGAEGGNPYPALLALADRFAVTADSVSMLVEVARLGRPLAVFDLERAPTRLPARAARALAGLLLSRAGRDGPAPAAEPLGQALFRRGWIRHGRDFDAIRRMLLAEGLATPLSQGFSAGGRAAPDDLPRVVERVRRLLD